jgi:hypothetical protein
MQNDCKHLKLECWFVKYYAESMLKIISSQIESYAESDTTFLSLFAKLFDLYGVSAEGGSCSPVAHEGAPN